MESEITRAREYFGEKPEESFAWKEVSRVCVQCKQPPLDPKSDDDIVWAFNYIAGGCGFAG